MPSRLRKAALADLELWLQPAAVTPDTQPIGT
jgi:hypothetical protein